MECHGCGDGFMIFMEGDLMDLMCGFRDLYILGSFKLIFAEAQGVFFVRHLLLWITMGYDLHNIHKLGYGDPMVTILDNKTWL